MKSITPPRSRWRCMRCQRSASDCRCCVLQICDQPGVTRVQVHCSLNPGHGFEGRLCLQHEIGVFLTHTLAPRCAQCFPTDEDRDRAIADLQAANAPTTSWPALRWVRKRRA